MARTKISEFSATPANNTDIDSINISEGCAPSGINDAIRELMAQLKDFQTGAVGDSFNGPVGASTASTGAFTTLSATGAITSTLATGTAPLVIASTTKVANLNADLLDGADWAAPAALGSTTPAAGAFTTLSASSTVTLSGGTANGVAYLNGSKVVTSGSALTFDGTDLGVNSASGGQIGFRLGWTGAGGPYDVATFTADRATGEIKHGAFTNFFQTFYANNSEAMRLTSTGLGIGTSSPATALHVSSGNFRLTNGAAFTTADSLIREINAASGSANQYVTASIGFRTGNFSDAGAITFGTANNASTPTERMRLDQVGNLGIGTSSPAYKLAISGVATTYASSASIGLYDTVSGVAASRNWLIGNVAAGNYGELNFAVSSAAGGAPTNSKMTLDSSGNLGLGVTPSAWGSTWKAIQVGMGGSIFARTADQNRIGITANAFFDTAFKYIGTGQATFYDQDDGNHYWYNAPSGTAGNAITFSQAMTLTANGELMVGTTTATGKASIAGAITATASSALVNPSVGVFGLYTGGAIPNTYVQMPSGGSIDFWKADTGVAARIDSSGNLLVGTTSNTNSSRCFVKSGGVGMGIQIGNTVSNQNAIDFYDGSGDVCGSITINPSANLTTYNTTSDYRLKNITGPITTSGAYIDSLNPVEGTWKSDGSTFVGLIAHEVQEASRTTVATGVKDGEEMQGMDYSSSEIIANLIAEVKSLRKRLADAGI